MNDLENFVGVHNWVSTWLVALQCLLGGVSVACVILVSLVFCWTTHFLGLIFDTMLSSMLFLPKLAFLVDGLSVHECLRQSACCVWQYVLLILVC